MYKTIPRKIGPKIYVFTGTKEDVSLYFREYKISSFAAGWDKTTRRIYLRFVCDNVAHLGSFIVLSLRQMIVLPFKHRLFFNKKKAIKRQRLNLNK